LSEDGRPSPEIILPEQTLDPGHASGGRSAEKSGNSAVAATRSEIERSVKVPLFQRETLGAPLNMPGTLISITFSSIFRPF